MFKRKDKQDVLHQTNIKRGITSHFARTLKVLQQRHLQRDSDEFIYSDDFSNNLCSALEAVFLHGLKDSVVTKMSSYVGLATDQDQFLSINFWSVCAKFTHKDVITQLRSLAQISTDIGLCRSWIRLALNDGLMESYLHSMIIDHKLLAYYYHSYSYLRDHEQPAILKNFLTGLMSLSFQLSFNSSVLNGWSNTSLQLAGLLNQHAPTPALSGGDKASSPVQRPTNKKQDGDDEPIVVRRKSPKLNYKSDDDTLGGNSQQPMFSDIRDVEALRRMTLAQMVPPSSKSVTSEGSTSSHISCPDPGSEGWGKSSDSGRVLSPSLYPRADRESSNANVVEEEDDRKNSFRRDVDTLSVNSYSSGLQPEEEGERKRSLVVVEEDAPFFELELARSPGRPRSRRVTEDDPFPIHPKTASIISSQSSSSQRSHSHSLSNSPKPSDFAMRVGGGGVGSVDSVGSSAASPKHAEKARVPQYDLPANKENLINLEVASSSRPRNMTMARGYDEICATLPPVKLDPLEQEAILKKVLGEIDKQADIERDVREEQRISMSYDEVFEDPRQVKRRDDDDSLREKEEDEVKDEENNTRDSGVSMSTPQGKESEGRDEEVGVEDTNDRPKRLELDNIPPSPDEEERSIFDVTPTIATEETDIKRVNDNLGKIDIKHQNSSGGLNKIEEKVEDGGGEEKGGEATVVEVRSGEAESPSSGNYGNSLSGMESWSSQIEVCPNERDKQQSLTLRTRGQSFASMLKTYAGENSLISTTLDQVIQTFYGADSNSVPSPSRLSPKDDDDDNGDMIERQESFMEGFEILTPPSNSFQSFQEMDSCRSVFLFRIPREHGLSHQNYTCRGCSRPIGIIYGQPRLCEFDGGLYCYECHENNEAYIPSAIVYNWDFSKKKVCIENYKFLQELEDQALYDLEELNPKLKTHVADLETLTVLRQQLCFLKSYMFNCTQKVAESLRQRVWPREHLYERSSVYSINDIHQVMSGAFVRFIKDLVKFASKHVYECSLCCQKGFVCEVCRNPKVIFPFELDTTIRCSTCKSVYHKVCMTENQPCPKCARWGHRKKPSPVKKSAVNNPEDYGTSPNF